MNLEPWLALSLAPNIGPATAARLLQQFGSAEHVVGANAAQLKAAGLSAATVHAVLSPDTERLKVAQDWLQEPDHHLLHWHDDRYPELLKETGDSPPVLYITGDPELLAMPQLAVVGSRNATVGGTEIAANFASHLVQAGLIITSGLAEGIDTAAHGGALDAGGQTIAILGTGPDTIYPASNQSLAKRISKQGALVTEFPPGMPVRRENFPQRNRIISGLSMGVLVIEAGMRSGSLITARLATNYGREVFAVPGSIHSPVSKGCHRLIKQGAKLVENSTDIMEEVSALAGVLKATLNASTTTNIAATTSAEHDDPDYTKLLCSMSFEPVDIETLANRSGLTAGELSSMLLILELEGRVEILPGGRFQQLNGWNEAHE